MGIVDRVKNILLTPKAEWPVIAGETPSTGDLLGGYVAPLAGISVLCGFVGSSVVGMSLPFMGTVRTPILAGIGIAVFSVRDGLRDGLHPVAHHRRARALVRRGRRIPRRR